MISEDKGVSSMPLYVVTGEREDSTKVSVVPVQRRAILLRKMKTQEPFLDVEVPDGTMSLESEAIRAADNPPPIVESMRNGTENLPEVKHGDSHKKKIKKEKKEKKERKEKEKTKKKKRKRKEDNSGDDSDDRKKRAS